LTITIKPHHLLDVFKLYGRGIYPFVPNPDYQHDFYLIGNLLLDKKIDSVVFTSNSDDICKSCKYNNLGLCADKLLIGSFTNKDEYNKFIDGNLLIQFGLEENRFYDFNSLLFLIKEKMSLERISEIWCYNDKRDNELRFQDTLSGIMKILAS